jgi:hypothetical protein
MLAAVCSFATAPGATLNFLYENEIDLLLLWAHVNEDKRDLEPCAVLGLASISLDCDRSAGWIVCTWRCWYHRQVCYSPLLLCFHESSGSLDLPAIQSALTIAWYAGVRRSNG